MTRLKDTPPESGQHPVCKRYIHPRIDPDTIESMFSSAIKKRSFALAAPLLLFSIACTTEVGTTPTTVAPTDTPTPTVTPPSLIPTNTPTSGVPTSAVPTTAPTSEPSPPPAQPTATATTTDRPSNQPAPTPTPTVAVPVAAATPTPTVPPPPTNTPTPMPAPPAETGNRVGNMAPDFTLTEVSTGQPVQLAELTEGGRPVVLYFFTTW